MAMSQPAKAKLIAAGTRNSAAHAKVFPSGPPKPRVTMPRPARAMPPPMRRPAIRRRWRYSHCRMKIRSARDRWAGTWSADAGIAGPPVTVGAAQARVAVESAWERAMTSSQAAKARLARPGSRNTSAQP